MPATDFLSDTEFCDHCGAEAPELADTRWGLVCPACETALLAYAARAARAAAARAAAAAVPTVTDLQALAAQIDTVTAALRSAIEANVVGGTRENWNAVMNLADAARLTFSAAAWIAG